MTTQRTSHLVRVEERAPEKGQVIKAKLLREQRDAINALGRAIAAPRQVDQPRDPEAEEVLTADEVWVADTEEGTYTTEDETFTGTSSVTVKRILSVTMVTPEGRRILLNLGPLIAILD